MAKWFRRKRWGYGWMPCTWQGWVVTVLFIAAVMGIGFAAQAGRITQGTTLEIIAAMTVALVAVTAFASGKDSDGA
jgi:hypothetical protein